MLSSRQVRWLAPALYAAALSAYMWREGIPVGRERLLFWIVLGLLAVSTANLGGWARGVVFEQFNLPFLVQDALGIWTAPNGDRVAWFKDPDGNTLSVSCHQSRP